MLLADNFIDRDQTQQTVFDPLNLVDLHQCTIPKPAHVRCSWMQQMVTGRVAMKKLLLVLGLSSLAGLRARKPWLLWTFRRGCDLNAWHLRLWLSLRVWVRNLPSARLIWPFHLRRNTVWPAELRLPLWLQPGVIRPDSLLWSFRLSPPRVPLRPSPLRTQLLSTLTPRHPCKRSNLSALT
jgi:hypothetical protein